LKNHHSARRILEGFAPIYGAESSGLSSSWILSCGQSFLKSVQNRRKFFKIRDGLIQWNSLIQSLRAIQ
jgi:hypothetical protein